MKDKGLFARPPDLERDENGRLIGGQVWPAVPYFEHLAKTAGTSVQQQMLEVMLEVGATNDYWIHHHFARIATFLPSDLGKAWAEHEIGWLRAGNETHGLMEEELAKLAAKLFEDGEREAALELLSEVLAVQPDPEADKKKRIQDSDELQHSLSRLLEPRIRCDPYHYKEILDEQVAGIAKENPWGVLQILSNLLESAVVYDLHDPDGSKPHDMFHISRQAIEDDPNMREYDFEQNLITAVRDTAEFAGKTVPERIPDIVAFLEGKEWRIFRRIALNLLRVLEAAPIALIRERLLDRDLFHAFNGHHEYFMLIRDRFGILKPEEQQMILGWIDAAVETRKNAEVREEGLTPVQVEKRVRSWQYDRLYPIRTYLTGDWKEWFDRLAEEFEPLESDIPHGYSSWSGEIKEPRTPKTAQELAEMTNQEIIDFLRDWRPPANRFEPSPSALAGALGKVVEDNPIRFLDDVDRFLQSELDFTYVRGLFNGLYRSVKEENAELISPVLELCRRLATDPPAVKEIDLPDHVKRDGFDADPGWRPLYSSVIGFLEDLFKRDDQPSFNLRKTIWEILERFVHDPEPDAAYEERLGGHTDVSNASLNVLRGKALHAMMRYTMWVARHLKASRPDSRPHLNDLPEVKAVLESRLDLDAPFGRRQVDRAIFGQWLPQLVALDEEWVLGNLDRIFPREPDLRPLRMAAFATTILYVGRLYDKLIPIYAQEVELLGDADPSDTSDKCYEQRLVEHVMLFYARGKTGLEDGGLVARFFEVAPPRLTGHALSFLGRDMRRNHEEPVNEEVQTRLKVLWDWRVEACEGVEHLPDPELNAFGYWFAWGEFDPDWAFPSLIAALRGPGIGHSSSNVFETLSALFPEYPNESLAAAEAFVETSEDMWFYIGTMKEKGIWTLLQQAVKHEDSEIKTRAVALINFIGSKGNLEYRELLPG